ncbi:MAG: hypothetical protein U0Q16_24285 [Bryobacteraceae bacterium]
MFLLVVTSAAVAEDAREIVLKSSARDARDLELRRNYTYVEHGESIRYNAKGERISTERKTRDVTMLYGRPYRRLIEVDGKPLSADQEAKEKAKMDREVAKRSRESAKEAERERTADRKEMEEERSWRREVADAFDFRMVGEEAVSGKAAWVLEATPKPGYRARSRRGGFLARVRGKVWISQQDYRWVKVDAEVIDTISFGWFLARLEKGTRMRFEAARVGDEIWMPAAAWFKGTARIGMVKALRVEETMRWDGYRKFQTESRVVATGESK